MNLKNAIRSIACILLLLACALFLIIKARTKSDCSRYVRMFENRDLMGMDGIRPSMLETLTLEERNRVALAAARCISRKSVSGPINELRFKWLSRNYTYRDENEVEYRRKWWQGSINLCASRIVRLLAERRLTDEPQILPFLINGLSHTNSDIAQNSLFSLHDLTRRYSGYYKKGYFTDSESRRTPVINWWSEWWRHNKNHHPVCDAELEKRARIEVIRLAGKIVNVLKPRFLELQLFNVPQSLPLAWPSPLMVLEYYPEHWAVPYFPGYKLVDAYPWIVIVCRFSSPDLLLDGVYQGRIESPPELLKYDKICCSTSIKGTDLLVEIQAISKNAELLSALKSIE